MGPNGTKIQLSAVSEVASLERGQFGPARPKDELENAFVTDVSSTIRRNGLKIGYVRAYVLRREEMVPDFHRDLDQTSQELLNFGRLLFDHRGRLRSTYAVPGRVRAGTGVWGHELSAGSLAFVLEINVRPPYRSQGIEEAALDLLLQHLARTEDSSPHDQTWPSPSALFYLPSTRTDALPGDADPGRRDRFNECMNGSDGISYLSPCCSSGSSRGKASQERIPDLLLNYGFRRVGTSPYLAFSLDSQHPSHRFPKELDAPLLIRPSGASVNPQKDFPLHFHILAITPPTNPYGPGPDLFHLVSYIRTVPLAYIQRADHLGCTPLHLAASNFNLPVLRALLARSRVELGARRWDGLTPLDVLKEEMVEREDRRRARGLEVEDAGEDACLAWFLAAERGR